MLTGYTPRREADINLQKVFDVSEFEVFAIKSQRRHILCGGDGGDPRPGIVWSRACNDPGYLLTLQQIKPDEWANDENRIFWNYLHIGSDLPN